MTRSDVLRSLSAVEELPVWERDGEERRVYYGVLAAIAKGAVNAQELAQAVLEGKR